MPLDSIAALVAPIREGRADMVQGRRSRVPRPSERLLTWLAALRGAVGTPAPACAPSAGI